MAAVALLSLCVGALQPCPGGNNPRCASQIADGFMRSLTVMTSSDDTLAAVGQIGGLRVHNMKTGAAVPVPVSDSQLILEAAFTPDGARIAVAAEAGVGVYTISTGEKLWFVNGREHTTITVSPDGSRIASLEDTGIVHIWDATTGALLSTLGGDPSSSARGLRYTPDGSKLVCAEIQRGKRVFVWDANTGAALRVLTLTEKASGMSVSPDGQYLATGEHSKTFYFKSNTDGQYLATGEHSKTVRIYRLSDYSTVRTLSFNFVPYGLSFSVGSSYLVVVGQSSTYSIYSVASGSKHSSYTTPSDDIGAVAFLHTTNHFLTVGYEFSSAAGAPLLLWDSGIPLPAPTAGPVQIVSASGTQDVAGVPVAGAEVPLPAGGLALSGVPASLQGSSTAHATRVAMGEKLRLSCASGSCGLVVAVYACKRCADAANDFEAQMVAEGFTPLTCAPSFSVAGGSASGQHVMRAYHTSVVSGNPIELAAVVHATQYLVAFTLDGATGVPQPLCPPVVFKGPSPPCRCVV